MMVGLNGHLSPPFLLLVFALLLQGLLTCQTQPEGPSLGGLPSEDPQGRAENRAEEVLMDEDTIDGQAFRKPVEEEGEGQRYYYKQFSDGQKLISVVFGPGDKVVSCDIEDEEGGGSGLSELLVTVQLTLREIEAECEKLEAGNPSSEKRPDDKSDFSVVAPGTNYCGAGNRGGGLGRFKKADACCREHDFCPYSVPAFSTRYGLKNHRPYTISWHGCDIRFKLCLKTADTTSADVIGTTYFDVLSPPTFILSEVPPNEDTKASFSKRKIIY